MPYVPKLLQLRCGDSLKYKENVFSGQWEIMYNKMGTVWTNGTSIYVLWLLLWDSDVQNKVGM